MIALAIIGDRKRYLVFLLHSFFCPVKYKTTFKRFLAILQGYLRRIYQYKSDPKKCLSTINHEKMNIWVLPLYPHLKTDPIQRYWGTLPYTLKNGDDSILPDPAIISENLGLTVIPSIKNSADLERFRRRNPTKKRLWCSFIGPRGREPENICHLRDFAA